MLQGLDYLHTKKWVIHRDIKLENTLLDAQGKLKICDFGVSHKLRSPQERMSEQSGTPAYIAPEIIDNKGYSGFKVDLWSAGVCLYAMLTGSTPFMAATTPELHKLILSAKYELNPKEGNGIDFSKLLSKEA